MARKIVLGIIALALAIAFVAYKRLKELERPGSDGSPRQGRFEMVEPRPAVPTTQPSPAPALPDRETEAAWPAFLKKYGPDLEPTYTRGILTGVRRVGQVAAKGNFDPTQAQSAIARAREIADDLRGELGVSSELPFGEPLFQGNPHSAQVHFRQVFDGVPLAPYGGVTVLMGPAGELERLDSNAIPDASGSGVKVVNHPFLSVNDARGRAVQAFFSRQSDWSAGPPVEGGTHVLWMTRPLSERGPAEARHAYDFNVGGDQIVIDAETGAVLHRRSMRRH